MELQEKIEIVKDFLETKYDYAYEIKYNEEETKTGFYETVSIQGISILLKTHYINGLDYIHFNFI